MNDREKYQKVENMKFYLLLKKTASFLFQTFTFFLIKTKQNNKERNFTKPFKCTVDAPEDEKKIKVCDYSDLSNKVEGPNKRGAIELTRSIIKLENYPLCSRF